MVRIKFRNSSVDFFRVCRKNKRAMFKRFSFILLLAAAVALTGCKTMSPMKKSDFSYFARFGNFSKFAVSTNDRGETVLLSPKIKSAIEWNELIVSWNADAPTGTFLKVEARAISPHHTTKFYTMGLWSPDDKIFPRTSVRGQKDSDGNVETDTLALSRFANAAQIQVTLGGTNGEFPTLKFLGLSFCNTKVKPVAHPINRAAWGKIIPTPERSQNAYPQEDGWCSPTSLSMVLERWAGVLHRPEINLDVPAVAAGVYDDAYDGTGNWPFNTAFAGSFKGMRAYVTRFDSISELEDWVAAGIPVIISAPWNMLEPGRPNTGSGHLTVCIGFTKDGDVVINDPGTNPKKSVRHIYRRANVIRAWATSHNTVYLVYPTSAKIPKNRFRQW
jgi:Peptidase_C39 like family